MQLTIRKAEVQDLDAVAALYDAVCGYLADKPFNPGWRKGIFPAREDAEQYLAADGLYIALDGGEAVGTIALTPDAGRVLCIHELAVCPERFRHGIGAVLLDFAEKTAGEQGATAVRLHVWEGNTPAVKAYEKKGYVRLRKEDIGLRNLGLDWFCLYEKQLDG